jgi:hypothetical protein
VLTWRGGGLFVCVSTDVLSGRWLIVSALGSAFVDRRSRRPKERSGSAEKILLRGAVAIGIVGFLVLLARALGML